MINEVFQGGLRHMATLIAYLLVAQPPPPPPPPPSMAYDNANSYRLLVTLNGQHDDTITCMQFSPCGEYLVTGADDLRMNVFDCANNFKNILSISSTSPASAICWDPDRPKTCFMGYSSGAVVSHTFGSGQEEWAAEILLFNGRCRVVALAWDNMLAVATERNVFLINDIKAGESVGSVLRYESRETLCRY